MKYIFEEILRDYLLKVLAAGYRVKYFVHSTGLSPTPQRDPFLIRLVGEK